MAAMVLWRGLAAGTSRTYSSGSKPRSAGVSDRRSAVIKNQETETACDDSTCANPSEFWHSLTKPCAEPDDSCLQCLERAAEGEPRVAFALASGGVEVVARHRGHSHLLDEKHGGLRRRHLRRRHLRQRQHAAVVREQ